MILAVAKKRYRIIVFIFFAAFLFIGLNIFKDYSISWDEEYSRDNGISSLRSIIRPDRRLLDRWHFIYYGPAFEMVLATAEIGFGLTGNLRAVYLMRHLGSFLLFYLAVCFFYLLCKDRFRSWKAGLLGSLLLILSPRIFSHAFYNSRDIASLSLFIISVYTLIVYLKNKSLVMAFVHAMTSAFLIAIRITGVLVPFLTVIFFFCDVLAARQGSRGIRKAGISILTYAFFLYFFTMFFWPAIRPDPLPNLLSVFRLLARFPEHGGNVLYLGNYFNALQLPWHYIPLWIAISTPLAYIACFIAGCFISLMDFLKDPAGFYSNKKYDLVYISWFFLPLLAVIVLRSVFYGDWRHMFFVYPALVIISLIGLKGISGFIKQHLRGLAYKSVITLFILLISLDLVNVSRFMVKNHPYQNLYFNYLAGKNAQQIEANFELDYWDLSSRQALEYIVKNDPDPQIKVHVDSFPGKANAEMLAARDKNRLAYVDNIAEAKYYLKSRRGREWQGSGGQEVYSITVEGIKIMSVYKQ